MKCKLRRGLGILMSMLLFATIVMPAFGEPLHNTYEDAFKVSRNIPLSFLRSIIMPEVSTKTFIFKVDGKEVDRQIVKDNETLIEPQAPRQNNKIFVGWFIESNGGQPSGGGELDFSQPISVPPTQPKNTDITVKAQFVDAVHVFFHSKTDKGQDEIVETKLFEPNKTTSGDDVAADLFDSTRRFDHWSATEDGPAFDFNTPISQDTHLYAVYKNSYRVMFDSDGGTFTQDVQVDENDNLSGKVKSPSKDGYKFLYWSLTKNGSEYKLSTPITKPLKLYAVWQKASANYTVLYWQENAEDSEYSLAETVQRNGTTGDSATYEQKSYSGFTFQKADQATIAGDGSTVVNVYYSRNTYLLKFRPDYTQSWQGYQDYIPEVRLKHGQDTTKYFNDATQAFLNRHQNRADRYTYNWFMKVGENQASYIRPPLMPMNDVINYPAQGRGYRFAAEYRELNPDGTTSYLDRVENRYGDFFQGGGLIRGFTYQYVNRPGTDRVTIQNDGTVVYPIYTRNKYNVTLVRNNGEDNVNIQDIYYQRDIPSDAVPNYVKGQTTITSGERQGYIFDGWYDNQYLQGKPIEDLKAYLSGKKMPDKDLVFYAKWVAPKHEVRFHYKPSGASGNKIIDTVVVSHNETIGEQKLDENKTKAAVPPGLTIDNFDGWFFENTQGQWMRFRGGTPVSKDIDLYPMWHGLNFPVEYDLNGGSGTTPNVPPHRLNAMHRVADLPEDVTGPDNRVFLGWKLETNGLIYQPGQEVPVNKDTYKQYGDQFKLRFVAQWGRIAPATYIKYDPNGGNGSIIKEDLANNSSHTAKSSDTFSRPGYDFKEWNTKSDGSGKSVLPGSKLTVDLVNEATENTLYAIWERATTTVSLEKYWIQKEDETPIEPINLEFTIEYSTDNTNWKPVPESELSTLKEENWPQYQPWKLAAGSNEKPGWKLYVYDDAGKAYSYRVVERPAKDVSKEDASKWKWGEDGSNIFNVTGGESSNPIDNYEAPEEKFTVEKITSKVTDSEDKERPDKKFIEAGDKIYYSFKVVNTGETTITQLHFKDDKLGLDKTITLDPALEPNKEYVYDAEKPYIITKEDIEAQKVNNTVSVNNPGKPGVPPTTDENEVPLNPIEKIEVIKETTKVTSSDGSVTREGNKLEAVGDKIYYQFTVTNKGNQSITKLNFRDDLLGLNKEVSLPTPLAPGKSYTYTPEQPYSVTQQDLDNGSVKNTVYVKVPDPEKPNKPEVPGENVTPNNPPRPESPTPAPEPPVVPVTPAPEPPIPHNPSSPERPSVPIKQEHLIPKTSDVQSGRQAVVLSVIGGLVVLIGLVRKRYN